MTETHMAREIAEIPDRVREMLTCNAATLDDIGAALRAHDPQLVTSVARGSSDHAATYMKYACEILTGVPVASVGPSVASVYGVPLRLPRTLCVGISQSGKSPDIVAMTRASASAGAKTLAITNHPEAPLGATADFCLPLGCGPEQSVAATKTFVTSVVAALAMLAHWAEDTALKTALAKLPDACATALAQDWSPLADRLVRAPALYVLGRGPGYAIASEIALKFKETSAIHAEAYSAAEVLHGPSALVERGFPVLGLICDDAARDGFCDTAAKLAGQGADVFVTDKVAGTTELPRAAPLHPLLDPLLSVVSFYVFIEALARRRGLQPDTPRHLRKVTETV
ncbi:Glutamine--fructose-6-phosphate aminotransferase [isomerizing] [Roseibaca ekhonensis]|uniref:Glutamine--fructose-6-phosphate aminotransferase [isomerizing] n=1 Tax=Roseinatronobacter ekhonensis TaxID=254356 RepID=A0A3B0MSU4_9RHOB|nr:SIS domain-containing protein [Roseibaca ekhonensis]SUZ32699.1 Glutamine--fructose-6-phosphate aminotransferase [isomerizing] [Roseibaca ekhonensis]